jgi:D-alanyl-D-alanine carboxypeptidase
VEDLLYGLMLASANDAAEALAIHAAGSIETFAGWMNERAAAIGMANSHFANPNGLDDPAGQHYSTARDMALLTASAMENPAFCRFFAAESHEIHGTVFPNHNKLLQSYAGCIGGKTGYTRAAGRTLVSVAERDGLRLICVTLTDPNDWVDHAALFDEGFAAYQFLTFPESRWRAVPVISGTAASVQVKCSQPYALVHRSDETQIHVSLPRFVFAPVQRGDVLGTLNVTLYGKVLLRADLLAAADVPVDESQRLTLWERFVSLSDRYAAALTGDVFFA